MLQRQNRIVSDTMLLRLGLQPLHYYVDLKTLGICRAHRTYELNEITGTCARQRTARTEKKRGPTQNPPQICLPKPTKKGHLISHLKGIGPRQSGMGKSSTNSVDRRSQDNCDLQEEVEKRVGLCAEVAHWKARRE
jgi:hypothetical protein